jgi:importin subunit beta-1
MQEGITEAYVGIAQGLKSADKGQLLVQYAPQIFTFLAEAAVEDDERPEYLTRSLIGLVGYFYIT